MAYNFNLNNAIQCVFFMYKPKQYCVVFLRLEKNTTLALLFGQRPNTKNNLNNAKSSIHKRVF